MQIPSYNLVSYSVYSLAFRCFKVMLFDFVLKLSSFDLLFFCYPLMAFNFS